MRAPPELRLPLAALGIHPRSVPLRNHLAHAARPLLNAPSTHPWTLLARAELPMSTVLRMNARLEASLPKAALLEAVLHALPAHLGALRLAELALPAALTHHGFAPSRTVHRALHPLLTLYAGASHLRWLLRARMLFRITLPTADPDLDLTLIHPLRALGSLHGAAFGLPLLESLKTLAKLLPPIGIPRSPWLRHRHRTRQDNHGAKQNCTSHH